MPGSFLPLSSREEREWLAFEAVHGPWTLERHDGYLSTIALTLANAYRDTKLRKEPWTHDEAFGAWDSGLGKPAPEHDGPPPELAVVNAMLGGIDLRPPGGA